MAELADAIENCKWTELETWFDAHCDLLIQHPEAEAPAPSVGSVSCPSQNEPSSRRKDGGDEASSGASTSKPSPHGK